MSMLFLKAREIFFKSFISVLLIFTISSCSDFLDKAPQGNLTQTSFPTTPEDALQATNAMYNVMRKSNFNYGLFPIIDIMSDDAYKGSNPTDQAATIGPYDNFTNISAESTLNNWWATLYEGIKRTNVVIERVPQIAMDQNLQTRYLGEAHFLRAVFYFDMVRAWGGVPIIDALNPSVGQSRATQQEVYNLIIEDLSMAIAMLPEKSDYPAADLGRATKGAARGFLAKVYLFQNDFVNAEKYALEVINSGQYGLEPNFEDANSVNGEFGVESIFEIGAIGLEGIQNGGNQFGNTQGVRGTPNRGWGFNRPSLDLMAAFEPNDPREEATIIYLGEVLDGITIIGDSSTPDETKDTNGNLVEIECYNQKVWMPGNNVPTQFDYNRRLLRYADVLLMAAEALNENNKQTQALTYLNMVRQRARAGNAALLLDITETNQSLLRDIIFHERRVELALEGHRFWDLVRTGRAEAVLGPLGFVKGKNELLPIPQAELDLTQGSISQNPNWN